LKANPSSEIILFTKAFELIDCKFKHFFSTALHGMMKKKYFLVFPSSGFLTQKDGVDVKEMR
jgi:hypothetical protein